jgi:hypothetical protein
MSMAEKPKPEPKDRDEPVTIPLDPEVALRALLRVQPAGEQNEDSDLTSDRAEK